MQGTLRLAHLVVGATAVVAFLFTGMLMHGSRHIDLLCGALVNLALGVHHRLPEHAARRGAAIVGSVLVLVGAVPLFFPFFAEPMAGRSPGHLSGLGLFALFGGVLLFTLVGLRRSGGASA